MKKLFISSLLSLLILVSYAQFPVNSGVGNVNTNWYQIGAVGTGTGFHFRYNYPDTIAANAAAFIKNIPNFVIVANDTLRKRNNSATKWDIIGGNSIAQFNPIAGTGISLSGTYPNITFTNTSLGNTLSNIGTGYRWAVPNTNNVKTVFSSFALNWDSTTHANGLTPKIDTALLATIYRVDSVVANIPISSLRGALRDNSILNQGYHQEWNWNDIASNGGSALIIRASESLGNGLIDRTLLDVLDDDQINPSSNDVSKKGISSVVSGSNSTLSGSFTASSYGGYFSATTTDGSSNQNNYGIYADASNGFTNHAAWFNGRIKATNLPSGVGTKQLRINAAGEVTTADTTIASTGWGLTGNLGTDETTDFSGTTDSSDFVQKANSEEYLRLHTYSGTETGEFGYIINSNYITDPSNFTSEITAAGGATGTPVAGGISLSVGATNFTQVFTIPNRWPSSVLPNFTYTAVGIKTSSANGLILSNEVTTTGLTYWARLWGEYDFATGVITIKLTNAGGTNTLATSSALPAITNGDSVECVFRWDYNMIYTTITNLRTSATVSVSSAFSAPNYSPTIYNPCVFFPLTTNPTVLRRLSVYTPTYKAPDFLAMGHSFQQGYAGVVRDSLYMELFKDATPRYKTQIDAMGSMRIADGQFWISEVRKINPKYVILNFGANDAGLTNAQFYANYTALVDSIKLTGIQVIHIGQAPQTGFDFQPRNDSLNRKYGATGVGDVFVDFFADVKASGSSDWAAQYDLDGIHPNVPANIIINAKLLSAIAPLIGQPQNENQLIFSQNVLSRKIMSYDTALVFNSDRDIPDKGYVDSIAAIPSGVSSFSATDGNGFDFTVTNPTTTPTLTAATSVGDERVLFASSGALTGNANFKWDNTYSLLRFGGQASTGWTNISAALMGGNATIMIGQSTDMWFTSNGKFNTGWRYLSAGFAANIGVFQQDVQLRAANTGSLDDAITWVMPIKATWNSGGIAGIGGDVTTTGGSVTGATLVATPSKVGIGQNVYIGDITTSPTEALHVSGNIRFSGALMPNNSAGTSGQVLTSAGAGVVPTWATPSTTATAMPISGLTAATAINSISNADYVQEWAWPTISNGRGLSLISNSTSAASNTQTLLNVTMQGTNANSTQTTYTTQISNNHAGTASTNIAAKFSATTGTNNYAIIVPTGEGSVGIGNSAPTSILTVTGNIELNTAGNKILIATGSNASIGTATLGGGTVTINTTAVTASSIIIVCYSGATASPGILTTANIVAGTSFDVVSTSGIDASVINWWIVN